MHFDKPDIALLFLFCIFTASALMLWAFLIIERHFEKCN
jgi:hypothetical protein